jgi:hypothetical protein
MKMTPSIVLPDRIGYRHLDASWGLSASDGASPWLLLLGDVKKTGNNQCARRVVGAVHRDGDQQQVGFVHQSTDPGRLAI